MKQIAILMLVIFANVWIWKIAGFNLGVFILLIITSVIFYMFTYLKYSNLKFALFMLLSLLLFLQCKTTNFESLILLSNDEQRVKMMRMQYYNPGLHYVRVIFYRLNLKEFLEGDFNTFTMRIQRNFFETIDPNVYFFGGHPRERVWSNDFEKFPFTLIVVFLIGLYKMISDKDKGLFLLIIPILLFTFLGHKNPIGPFLLFPFLVVIITVGTLNLVELIKRVLHKRIIIWSLVFVFAVNFIQTISYAF